MLFKDNLNKNEFLRQLYNVNLLTFAKITPIHQEKDIIKLFILHKPLTKFGY